MDTKITEKVIEAAGDAMKVAANLSEAKKTADTSSTEAQTGNQSVQIHMDTGKKREPRPVEKHIHEFPDNREMSERECDLALEKAKMQYDMDKQAQEYAIKVADRSWEHKLEVEKKREKQQKVRRVVGCVLAAFGIGYIGYNLYTNRGNSVSGPATPLVPLEKAGEAK